MDNILKQLQDVKDSIRAPELDNLISAMYGGVRIMPSDMVERTTILVTPRTWEALCDRIERDTAEEKAPTNDIK